VCFCLATPRAANRTRRSIRRQPIFEMGMGRRASGKPPRLPPEIDLAQMVRARRAPPKPGSTRTGAAARCAGRIPEGLGRLFPNRQHGPAAPRNEAPRAAGVYVPDHPRTPMETDHVPIAVKPKSSAFSGHSPTTAIEERHFNQPRPKSPCANLETWFFEITEIRRGQNNRRMRRKIFQVQD